MIYNSAMVKLTMRNKSFEVDAQWKLKLIGSRSKADRTLKDNCLSCCLFRERRVGEEWRKRRCYGTREWWKEKRTIDERNRAQLRVEYSSEEHLPWRYRSSSESDVLTPATGCVLKPKSPYKHTQSRAHKQFLYP